jgi:nitrile hydratase
MVHNVVVCTLCSCYPRNLLGLPPDWYKSRAYRSRAVIEPRKVLTEFGLVLSENVQVRVHDSTADMRYIVIPSQPEASKGLPVPDLVKWVTRDSMIGVGKAHAPT